MRCAHHFSLDPQVEDLVSHQGRLTPVSYHPLWDGLAPSFADGIDSCLQYLRTSDILVEVGVGVGDSGTCGCYHLHSSVGCEYQFDGGSGVDRVGISVGLSSTNCSLNQHQGSVFK